MEAPLKPRAVDLEPGFKGSKEYGVLGYSFGLPSGSVQLLLTVRFLSPKCASPWRLASGRALVRFGCDHFSKCIPSQSVRNDLERMALSFESLVSWKDVLLPPKAVLKFSACHYKESTPKDRWRRCANCDNIVIPENGKFCKRTKVGTRSRGLTDAF